MTHAILAALGLATTVALPAAAEGIKVGMLLPYSGVYASLANDIDAGFALGLATFNTDAATRHPGAPQGSVPTN